MPPFCPEGGIIIFTQTPFNIIYSLKILFIYIYKDK
ncbi:hypothetical protein H650_09570 [Enterobacter sp. R4-368]|nr:hypothetical protein H650_09570 [Enterobacter sp. R4-368]